MATIGGQPESKMTPEWRAGDKNRNTVGQNRKNRSRQNQAM